MADSPALDPSALLAQQSWVERLARGLVRDSSLAADLAQEAWLAARARGPEESAARRGFLAGVVANLRRNEARGARRRTAREALAARPEALPSAAELVEKAELARLLVESVLALDEHERTAVLLRYFEDLSAEEIARRSGVPAGTVRARLARGLERLRARLEARVERRELLAGLLVLGRESTLDLAPASTVATTLPWIGGLMAMKGFTLAAGGAVLLTLAAGLWWTTRAAGVRGARGASADSAPPAELVAEAERAPTAERADGRTQLATEAPVSEPAPAPVEVRPPVRLLAEVVDENRLGLAGVDVLVNEQVAGASGPRGAVALELSFDDRHEGLIVVQFSHPDHARVLRTVGLRATGEVHLGRIELAPAANLRGHVLDESGRPVAGAQLLAGGLEDPRTDPELLRRLGPLGDEHSVNGTSAADGSFALAQVPLGAGRLWAGHAGSSWSAQRFELGRGGLDGLELVLQPLQATDVIAGRVVDPAGRPVPGAELHTWFMAANYGSSSQLTADAEGRFELRLEQRVPHDLTVRDPENRWSEVYRDAVEPGTRELVLAFEEPRWIALEVRASGRALEQFALELDGRDGERHRRMTATTEPERAAPFPDGRVNLRVPSAPFGVLVSNLGHESARQGPFTPATAPERLVFELEPLPGVRGIVRTSAGAPAAGAKIGLYALVGDNVVAERNGFRLRTEGWTEASTTADVNGRFVLYPPEPGDGLYRGRASVLRVTADGHAPTELAPRVYEPREGLELEIELLRGGTIEGIVSHGPELDPSGYVLAFHRGDGNIKSVRLGPDGRFRLDGLAPGAWEVQVLVEEMVGNRSSSSSSYDEAGAPPFEEGQYIVVDGETTYCTIDLGQSAPARLRGMLTLPGASAHGWSATLVQELVGSEDLAATGPLDARGGFTLLAPRAGAYELRLTGPEEPNGRLELSERLTLAPGDQNWTLTLSTARLAGSGALAPGTRERFYRYEWLDSAEGHALTARVRLVPEASGHFTLSAVPAGRGRIARNDPLVGEEEFAPWETLAEFELVPGSSETIALP